MNFLNLIEHCLIFPNIWIFQTPHWKFHSKTKEYEIESFIPLLTCIRLEIGSEIQQRKSGWLDKLVKEVAFYTDFEVI